MERRTIRHLLLAASLVALSGCAAGTYSSYDITSVRADKNDLYIYYRKRWSIEAASILNVHGGLVFDHKSDFYTKVEKSSLRDGYEFDLLKGESFGASSHIVYEDDEFLVKDYMGISFPTHGVREIRVTVTTHEVKSTVACGPDDAPPYNNWGGTRPRPLRVEDKLILCGKIVPAGGTPQDGPAVLFDHRYDRGVAHDGMLYFLNPPERDRMGLAEGAMQLAKVDAHTFQPAGTVTLPIRWEDAETPERYPNGFVIRSGRGKTNLAYACMGEKCRKFDCKGTCPSALLMGDSGDALIAFAGAGSATKYRVWLIKAEPE